MDTGPWAHAPRLPLADSYSGRCLAQPLQPHFPPEEQQRDLCNCGYARGRCDRFPESADADAVRFSVIFHAKQRIRLVYILEKNHAPAAHGMLEFSTAAGRFLTPALSEVLERQARAYVEAYFRRVVR